MELFEGYAAGSSYKPIYHIIVQDVKTALIVSHHYLTSNEIGDTFNIKPSDVTSLLEDKCLFVADSCYTLSRVKRD